MSDPISFFLIYLIEGLDECLDVGTLLNRVVVFLNHEERPVEIWNRQLPKNIEPIFLLPRKVLTLSFEQREIVILRELKKMLMSYDRGERIPLLVATYYNGNATVITKNSNSFLDVRFNNHLMRANLFLRAPAIAKGLDHFLDK